MKYSSWGCMNYCSWGYRRFNFSGRLVKMHNSCSCNSCCYFISLVTLGLVCITVILSIILRETSSSFFTEEPKPQIPLAINTWPFTNATAAAWDALYNRNLSALDAVEIGCSVCEQEQCDFTVGYGGSPDENGETTLDAFIMDGMTMNVGAVGALRGVKSAISVARRVLDNTKHSILVGELATQFAVNMGFTAESLSTNKSEAMWQTWRQASCQPNYWKNVLPDPRQQCGPYKPRGRGQWAEDGAQSGHDTISMLAIDRLGQVAAGTSSNGANHKIPGRVGDAPLVGAGGYADGSVGGAACTGDGDVMMRFLPSFLAVEEMRRGATPLAAAREAISRVARFYPSFSGAIITANLLGEYAAACHGMNGFPFSVHDPAYPQGRVVRVDCL